jgi:outer membrane protein TolC
MHLSTCPACPVCPAGVVPTLALVLTLSLSACGALAPHGRPAEAPAGARSGVEAPAAWSMLDAAVAGADAAAAPTQAASLVDWWRRFDDPLLARLISLALHDNTSLQGAQAALRQAQALRDVAAAALWPTLGINASAGRNRTGNSGGGHNSFQLGLNADWLPDLFGSLRGAVDAADAAVQASRASLGDVQVQLAAELALDYIVLRTAQARLAIAVDNLASQQDTLQITRWREQAGLVTTLESEQARAAVEQTAAGLPGLRTSQIQARHALAVLTGQPPAALDRLLPLLGSAASDARADAASGAASPAAGAASSGLPPERMAAAPAFGSGPGLMRALPLSIPARTLRQRADLRVAEHQVDAAQARVTQAEAQRWPSFSIGGTLGLGSATLGALSSGASIVSSVLASVSLPLWDGGAGVARVAGQQAAVDQARQVYRATALLALRQVEDALAALAGDRERLASLDRAAQAADQAAQLASLRYRAGLVDFQVVLDTQRSRYATQDALASARADVSADQVRLYTALGGGWRAEDEATIDLAERP